jgi:hypothetical protein
VVMRQYGLTAEHVYQQALALLEEKNKP